MISIYCFRGVVSTEDVPTVIRPREPAPGTTPSPPPTWNREKNQYGDVWDKQHPRQIISEAETQVGCDFKNKKTGFALETF